jgi:hypothetical protein
MAGDPSEIDIESIGDAKKPGKVQNAITGLKEENIDWAGCALLEEYISEEMSGAHRILDKDGNATAAYIYEVADEYVIGSTAQAGISTTAYGISCTTSAARWHEYAHA